MNRAEGGPWSSKAKFKDIISKWLSRSLDYDFDFIPMQVNLVAWNSRLEGAHSIG